MLRIIWRQQEDFRAEIAEDSLKQTLISYEFLFMDIKTKFYELFYQALIDTFNFSILSNISCQVFTLPKSNYYKPYLDIKIQHQLSIIENYYKVAAIFQFQIAKN